uniref:Uncharacterized protein n=1 Tax=Haptolina brevifila TaxID=156173 RepID=A0A7S2BND7_9EUKA
MDALSITKTGESFRLQLDGYFTEQQRGRTLNLQLEYGYAGVLPLESMPDYRLIQLLVEDVLYVYPVEWVDIFWEMANRELVRRLLEAFPQIAWARCEMSVVPSDLLPISRTSIVEWRREDMLGLGSGLAPFYRPLPDECWYASPPPVFNIGAPRYLLASLAKLYQTLAASPVADEEKVVLSFVPTCLAASAGTFDELLALCTVHGIYDALVLPRRAVHKLKPLLQVGSLTGLVKVVQKEQAAGNGSVVEQLLHSLLGAPPGYSSADHAAARSGFFSGRCIMIVYHGSDKSVVSESQTGEMVYAHMDDNMPFTGRYASMILEARVAVPLSLRGYEVNTAFEGEALELVIPPKVSGTPRVAAAIATLKKVLG